MLFLQGSKGGPGDLGPKGTTGELVLLLNYLSQESQLYLLFLKKITLICLKKGTFLYCPAILSSFYRCLEHKYSRVSHCK